MTNITSVPEEQILSIRTLINKNQLQFAKDKVQELEARLQSNESPEMNEKFLILATLANYYHKTNNYDKAASYYRQAENISKKVDKAYIEITVDLFLDFASLEREYKQFQHARVLLAKLLEMLEKGQMDDKFVFGRTYSTLGKVYLDEDNIENGIIQLEKALNYFKQAVPSTHPMIAQMVHTISDVYVRLENYNKALEISQELLNSYKKENDQIAEGKMLLRVGEIYFYINLKDARKTITNGIKKLEEVYEEEHLDIAKGNLMLAELDENMGKLKRALTYYKRALEQLMNFYDESHFMIVYVYSKIGTISIKTEELHQAKAYLEKGLERSTDFPKIRQQFLYALGKIYSGEKDYDRAFSVFQEFLKRLEDSSQKKTKAYANTLQALAFNELEQDRFEQALKLYEEALEIYEQLSPDVPEEKGLTYIRLAYSYENIKNPNVKKAENYYETGFRILEKLRDPAILEEALAGIIDFFTRNNNPKKRRKYEDKFVKLQNANK